MKLIQTGFLAGTIVAGSLFAQQNAGQEDVREAERVPGAEDEPVEAAQPVGAEEWVRNLADESFKVREAAQQALWTLGEEAVAALEEAAKIS